MSIEKILTPTPMRLVDYAKAYLVAVPIDDVGELIARGALVLDGRPGRIADLVRGGERIDVDAAVVATRALRPQPIPLVVHYEDEALLVCDKPAGMHVHPLGPHREDTLLNALLWYCGARPDAPWGRWRPRPLHRLDRAASGLIAIAKRAAVHDHLRRALAERSVERRYRAVVYGRVEAAAGTIDAPLGRDPTCDYRRAVVALDRGGQHAVTHYRRVEHAGDRTLVELTLETGRTHQIRAHLASIGHPIVGDRLYTAGGERRDAAPAIALHASELRLGHPDSGELIACTSSPPPDFGVDG